MIILMVAMVLMAVLIAVFAGGLATMSQRDRPLDPRAVALLEERLAPIGEVRTGDAPAPVQQAAADTGGEPLSGAEVNTQVCATCHASGVMNAPRTGDTAAWQSRLAERDYATLVQHAINGFNAMPAKGGNPSLSDGEVEAAVDHLLAESGIEP